MPSWPWRRGWTTVYGGLTTMPAAIHRQRWDAQPRTACASHMHRTTTRSLPPPYLGLTKTMLRLSCPVLSVREVLKRTPIFRRIVSCIGVVEDLPTLLPRAALEDIRKQSLRCRAAKMCRMHHWTAHSSWSTKLRVNCSP